MSTWLILDKLMVEVYLPFEPPARQGKQTLQATMKITLTTNAMSLNEATCGPMYSFDVFTL